MSNGARNQLSIEDLQAEEGPVTMVRNGIHKQRRRLVGGLKAVLVVAGVVGASGPAMALQKAKHHNRQGNRAWECAGESLLLSTILHSCNPSWGRRIRRQRRMWHRGQVS